MLPAFALARPADLAAALAELAAPGARPHAGGTDLLGCLRDGVFGADKLVSLRRLESLRPIRATSDGGLALGALATLAEIAASPLVRERAPGLAQAAAAAASPQLRNQGTLGGNLCQRPRCWYFRGEFACLKKGGGQCFAVEGENRYHAILGGGPCYIVHPSDTAPMLVALGAKVRLAGRSGERTLALADFFVLPEKNVAAETALAPGELLLEVLVPPSAGWTTTYRKVRERGAWDFALASVALALKLDGRTVSEARVVLGGVAPVPWRARAAEQALAGRELTAATARAAAEAATAGAEPLAHNGFKVPLVRGVVEESLLTLA